MPDAVRPIRHTLTVQAPPERAFAVFTEGLGAWWPPEYTWGGDALEKIVLEPKADGRCYELGPEGFHLDWGRVRVWDPPERVVFTWQIGPDRTPQPDPARASEVEVRFLPEGEACRVELEHRGFERHGEGGAGYRERLASAEGWPLLLHRYAGLVA